MLLARYQSLVFVYYVHVYVYHDDEQNVYDLLVRLYGSECWGRCILRYTLPAVTCAR